MDRDAVVHLRPHFARRGRSVFFLVARKPSLELAEEEIALFDRIDGARFAELDPKSQRLILRWQAASIVEVIPPRDPPPSPHLVVVEPHVDDAVLSVGGRLLNRRGKQRITILTVHRWSNFTSYWFANRFPFDLETVTELRRKEGALAAELCGAEHVLMDGLEANLRFVPAGEWSAESFPRLYRAYEPYLHSIAPEEETRALADRLAEKIASLQPDELWIPMGVGEHVDHRLVADACLEMLRRQPRPNVMLYEDLPYAAQFPVHAPQLIDVYERHGGRFGTASEEIGDVLEQKLRAVSVFASQWKIEAIAPSVSMKSEVGHRILELPRAPPPHELGPHAEVMERMRKRVEPWLRARTKHRSITVIAAGPFARFDREIDRLLETFPSAELQLLILEDFAWQVHARDRVHIEIVPKDPLRWARAILKALPSRSPAILIRYPSWTPKHRAMNQAMLRALWTRPRVLASSLSEVTTLLRST